MKTKNGLLIYSELHDLNGHPVRVQESSLATTEACWIFAESEALPLIVNVSLHLSKAQAKRLIRALTKFVDS